MTVNHKQFDKYFIRQSQRVMWKV